MAIKSADQITIIDVTDAYSVGLSSEAYTFIGDTTGAPANLTCTTDVYALCGSDRCSVSVSKTGSNAIVCPTGIEVSNVSINTEAKLATITFRTTAQITSACEATIPVVVDNGIVINKKFSFAVAKTGANGADGKGISSTVIKYQKSSSGTSIPTGTWLDEIPAVSAGEYLWTRTTINYTSGNPSHSYSVGRMGTNGTNGTNGKGITSTVIDYQKSSSGTTVPTGTWSAQIPSLNDGEYLWTRTTITYTSGSPSYSYSVGMKGATGAAGADAITISISSSNGSVFRNNSGSTVLKATVYKGGVKVNYSNAATGVLANNVGTVKWYTGNPDSTNSNDYTFKGASESIEVSASTVDSAMTFTARVEV